MQKTVPWMVYKGCGGERSHACTLGSSVEVRWVPGSYLLCQHSASPGSLARIHSG